MFKENHFTTYLGNMPYFITCRRNFICQIVILDYALPSLSVDHNPKVNGFLGLLYGFLTLATVVGRDR